MSARSLALGAAIAAATASPALAAPDCAPADLSALSAWEGVWAVEGVDGAEQGLSGRSGSADYKLIGLAAPWNEAGWSRMAAVLRQAATGAIKQGGWGFPMMMDSFSEFTFVVGPRRTAMINQYREVRTIYTDGRGHPPEDELWATNWGDSTGCWEGDTLIVDTVGVRFDPVFNMAAPPLSERTHFVERIRLTAPDRLTNTITMTDPAYLEMPWTVTLDYVPAGLERLVLDAYDDRNDTDGQTIIASSRKEFAGVPLPPSVTLTAGQLDAVAGRYAIDGAPVELGFEGRDGRLYFQPPGFDGWIPMFAQGPLEFVVLDGSRVTFITDAAGKVTGLAGTNPQGVPTTAKRRP